MAAGALAAKKALDTQLRYVTEAAVQAVQYRNPGDSVTSVELSAFRNGFLDRLERFERKVQEYSLRLDSLDGRTKEQREVKSKPRYELMQITEQLEEFFELSSQLKQVETRLLLEEKKGAVSEKAASTGSNGTLTKLAEILEKMEGKIGNESSKPASNQWVKLPSLELPMFNSDILSFREFWDTFYATVHSNPGLSAVQKMSYLKERLSGSALETIHGLNLCNGNYDVALQLLDDKGLLRCTGRLEYSDLPYEYKHPMLLPTGDHLAKLIIMEKHQSLKHAGVSQTLAEMRREFWIPKGRSSVKRVLTSCLICKRHEGGSFATPQMAPLPKERVSPGKAFDSVGVDYFGPLYIKNSEKVWVCLFTCLTTRAVHLELVRNMTTKHFLMAFRRFISRRGTPQFIVSDNAKQFKMSKHVIDLLWTDVISAEDSLQFASSNGIQWKFIVELAPWMGGVYERMVGVVKQSLRKSIGQSQMDFDQLQTVLTEVETIVNLRPLTYVGEDFNLGSVLTPAHFMAGNTGIAQPTFSISTNEFQHYANTNNSDLLASLWKKSQECLESFWQRWSSDYLLSLRRSTAISSGGKVSSECPTVDSIVLIKDASRPRGCWKLGKIIKLHESMDGIVRFATVKLPSKRTVNRPLRLLFPLECPPPTTGVPPQEQPPLRKAALTSRLRTADMIDTGYL